MSLPSNYATQMQRLGAAAWRERKSAAAKLREWIVEDRGRSEVLDPLVETLLDGLLSPDAIEGRAACHEVLVAVGPRCVPAVMRRLGEGSSAPRLLIDLLGELGDAQAVPRCALLLADRDADLNLRASAASALGRLGGAEAIGALRSALEGGLTMEGNEGVLAVHVLDALEATRARVDVALLRSFVEMPLSRKAATLVLGNSDDDAVMSVLLPLLEDPMSGVRAAAVLAIHRQAEAEPERIHPHLVALDESARVRVRSLVEHADLAVRVAAIRVSAHTADLGCLGSVLGAMDEPMVHEHAFAFASAAGRVHGAPVSVALLEAATQIGARQEHLLRLLGALGPEAIDPAVFDVLAHSLADPEDETALAAAEALSIVGSRESLRDLYRAMGQQGRRGEAAAEAMAAVLRRNAQAVHADLRLIVGNHWPQTGDLARNLCRVVGALASSRYATRLINLLGSADVGVRIAAALAIGQLEGEHEGLGALSFALADEEPQVRAAACRSLGGAPLAVPSLLSATTDDSPLVRSAAVNALVALDNPVALARFRAIVTEDPVTSVVVAAIAGLGSSGLSQDLTMLMSLCTSSDWEVVKAAARGLRAFGAHRATAALLGLLGHARWDVRWTAAQVLEARADITARPSLRRALDEEEDALVREVLERAVASLQESRP